MTSFVVSARKYRPSKFSDVIGQPQVTQTLRNAITANQVAQAFLFCGPRGVGKTTCARILAKAVNCLNLSADAEPCNECESCESFNSGTSLNIFELDAASNNSVDDIRALVDQVRFAPHSGLKKIYIIDEVHMLSQQAFNAFLKTLEEPPAYAMFILATTEKHKIIPTILSRCQVFDFNRIETADMAAHLAAIAKNESIEADEESLHLIAQKADGALRDALSMFDRISLFSKGNITLQQTAANLNVLDYEVYFRITEFFLSHSVSDCLLMLDEVIQKGFDGEDFLNGLSVHFRNLLVAKDEATQALMDFTGKVRKQYESQAMLISHSFLVTALHLLNESEQQYRFSRNKRLTVELALIRLCHISSFIENPSGLKQEVKKKVLIEQESELPVVSEPDDIPEKESAQPIEEIPNSPVPVAEGNLRQRLKEKLKESKLADPETAHEPEEIEPFAFRQVWANYLKKLSDEGKPFLLSILEAFPPEIVNRTTLSIKVGNQIHLHSLQEEKENLLYYLKKELGKKSIDFRTELDESKSLSDTGRKPYTAQEKYQFLLSRNAELQNLVEKLSLELDY